MKKTVSTTLFMSKNKDVYSYFDDYKLDYDKIWLDVFYDARDREIFNVQDSKYRTEIMNKCKISNRSAKVLLSEVIANLKSKIALRDYYYNMYSEKLESLTSKYNKVKIIVESLKLKVINNEIVDLKYYKAQKRKLWALANKINRCKQRRNSVLTKKLKHKRRTSQVSYNGSHEETCHNQQFQVKYDKIHNCFNFKLRKDNSFITNNKKYVYGSFYLKYLKAEFIRALDVNYNKPISYKLINKKGRLYLYITFDVDDIPIVTRNDNGVLGIDFNKGFISVSETNRCGNLINTFNIEYADYKHRGKNKESMLNMINELCSYSLKVGKDIVIEDLDFKKTKSRILKATSIKGKRYNDFIMTFPYKRFSNLIKQRCNKCGIGLGRVNPAYTSRLGAKLQDKMKLNIHNLAAFIIARRYVGFDKNKHIKKGYINYTPDYFFII